jgi:ankyrin
VKGGKHKETPLHLAAKLYDTEKCAEILLKSGAKPDAANEIGEIPLHIACKFGQIKVAKLLLSEGSSPFTLSKVWFCSLLLIRNL